MNKDIKIGGVYRHYKNQKLYKILTIAKHSETCEDIVVYIALYDNGQVWARPLSMWNELVVLEGKTYKRFELIED